MDFSTEADIFLKYKVAVFEIQVRAAHLVLQRSFDIITLGVFLGGLSLHKSKQTKPSTNGLLRTMAAFGGGASQEITLTSG
jgi:hypothetical protein